jgi:hypothetical protein
MKKSENPAKLSKGCKKRAKKNMFCSVDWRKMEYYDF